MIADDRTRQAIEELIATTYEALSTPGSDVARFFGADEITIAGSGLGELWSGPEMVAGAAAGVASMGLHWTAEKITVWCRGEVAWAQILGQVHVVRDDTDELVPYWTTGVFGLEDDQWRWLYWGGAEPQELAKV